MAVAGELRYRDLVRLTMISDSPEAEVFSASLAKRKGRGKGAP
jgi:hypothetical protein